MNCRTDLTVELYCIALTHCDPMALQPGMPLSAALSPPLSPLQIHKKAPCLALDVISSNVEVQNFPLDSEAPLFVSPLEIKPAAPHFVFQGTLSGAA